MRLELALIIILCAASGACREAPTGIGADAGDHVDAPVTPRDDLVPPVGSPGALDIATWNVENFPLRPNTAELVASLILSLDLDLVAVEEIADTAAFDQLLAFLPEYEGILSTHVYSFGSYQKVGFIYRRDLLVPDSVQLLFTGDSYAFPRPPLEVHFQVMSPDDSGEVLDFTAVVVHLKAGGDDWDRTRRRYAVEALDRYVRQTLDGPQDDDVVILGDFNETLDTPEGRAVWAPMTGAPEVYNVQTSALDATQFSYVPWAKLIDHVVTTRSLDGALVGQSPEIPRLNELVESYIGSVSDHLPVVISMPGLLE